MGRQTRDKEGNRLATDGKAGKRYVDEETNERPMERQSRYRWEDIYCTVHLG
jgi:hypothetical protein